MTKSSEKSGRQFGGQVAFATQADISRLWSKVRRRGPDECWPWIAATNGKGYGRIKIGGQLFLAHRVAYAATHGGLSDIPQYHGSVVMHTCDNPICCNPAHLRLGTQRQNVKDMVAKGRSPLTAWRADNA